MLENRSAIAPPLISAALLALLLVLSLVLGTLTPPSSIPALRTSPHPLLAPLAIAERAAPVPSHAPLAPSPLALPARLP
ncbi:hypothetical protein [Candidatus Chloroploca sp. Khr17]|uniref:hypothetical protein n=1 Tax=Candidatus Chloroploca sp. Khr17 TaxID=2496869 RepID=UPI00101DFB1F|nr:hypothetical protein [Candidatus Chloroploca sp. Khr17]